MTGNPQQEYQMIRRDVLESAMFEAMRRAATRLPADGEAGIRHFVMDCIRDGCYAGKICPPAIIGVGLGGTADLCMRLDRAVSERMAVVYRELGVPPDYDYSSVSAE